MKPIFYLACFLFLAGRSLSQEFRPFSNGLIYSDTTVQQLKHVVDSLNLKFKGCELNKTYYPMYQAKAHHIWTSKGNLKKAIKDMQNDMPFEEFLKQHEIDEADKDLLMIRYETVEDGEKVYEFHSLKMDNNHGHNLTMINPKIDMKGSLKGKWIYEYRERQKDIEDDNGFLGAFYIVEEMNDKPIPGAYARWIQYSDCLMDSNSTVFYNVPEGTDFESFSYDKNLDVENLLNYIDQKSHRPDPKGESYWQNYRQWDSLKYTILDSLWKNDIAFKPLMSKALESAKMKGGYGDALEAYVGRYYSKKQELELKRRRHVWGNCSHDQAPRMHSFRIAVLSAETMSWDIFLKAHLDIMNDNFARMSDGSYAWGKRETYIKELEVLDINVPDLLFGICLGIGNGSTNHYSGSAGRIGRAWIESKDRQEMEKRVKEMIANEELDDYNRLMMYNLFRTYNYYMEDIEKKEANRQELAELKAKLPKYIREKLGE